MLTTALPQIGTVLLAVTTVLYIRGLSTVDRLPGAEARPIRFSLAVTILLAVSLPPWDESGVTAHMVQHLVLFFVAAPLLGVSRAGPTHSHVYQRPASRAGIHPVASVWISCA